MTETIIDAIAINVIKAFLLLFNLSPSKGDSTEVRNNGPYRIYTTQAKIPHGTEIDSEKMYQSLLDYLQRFNAVPTAQVKFFALNIEQFQCPCGCGDYLYVSFYTC